MAQEYKEVEYNGVEAREYPDGSIRDSKGYWLTKPPGAADDITSDNARDMVVRKVEKRRQLEQDYREEAQRALVSKVARGKTPAIAGGKLVGMVAEELASEGSVKEHGLRGFTHAADWALTQAGLIQEKKTENTNIDKAVIVLQADTREHVEAVLRKLLPAGGAASRGAEEVPEE